MLDGVPGAGAGETSVRARSGAAEHWPRAFRASSQEAAEGACPNSSLRRRSSSRYWCSAAEGWPAAQNSRIRSWCSSSRSGSAPMARRAVGRLIQVALSFPLRRQPAERLDVQLGQPLLLPEDPLIVITRKQPAAVEIDRPRETLALLGDAARSFGGVKCRLELGHIG